jgi:hypothetical protein
MSSTITINGETGYLFRGLAPESFCFVPEQYVKVQPDDPGSAGHAGRLQMAIDEISYFLSGWSVRNMRAAYSEPGGAHLFPDVNYPIGNFEAPEVEEFVRRVTNRTRHPFASLG